MTLSNHSFFSLMTHNAPTPGDSDIACDTLSMCHFLL